MTAFTITSIAIGGCASSDEGDADPVTPGIDDDAGTCLSGQTNCRDICVDTKIDRSNCGAWDPTTDGAALIRNALFYVVPRIVTASPRLDLGNMPAFTPKGTGLRAATVNATVDGFATKVSTLLVGRGV